MAKASSTSKSSVSKSSTVVSPSNRNSTNVAQQARVQPRPAVVQGATGLTVETQEASDREVSERARLSNDAASRNSEKERQELLKAPGKPFKGARDALNKFSEEIQKIRDANREHWQPSEMRRLRDEVYDAVRSVEDMVTGDADRF